MFRLSETPNRIGYYYDIWFVILMFGFIWSIYGPYINFKII